LAPYSKSGHSKTQWVTIRGASGKRYQLPTGTHDPEVARDMELMVSVLGRRGSRDWDLVNALFEKDARGKRRLALARLYDHWRTGTLDTLRAELADVDLAPAIDEWLKHVKATKSAKTWQGYVLNLARLAPLGEGDVRLPLWRSQLTPAYVATKRDAVPGGVWSRLAHLTAWSSCCAWLVERGLLPENPLGKVAWPEAPRTRDVRRIDRLADVQRFVAAFDDAQDRAIAALREATGADWDSIEPMRREHVLDEAQRFVYLPGDKTHNRAREVQVEAWAWKHVAAYLATLPPGLPGARLFTRAYGTYRGHHNATRDALIAVGVAIPKGYSPHNARHSFAVRKRRLGWSDYKIAEYLGNTAGEVGRTYARFRQTREDLREDRRAGGET
jgi:site-specific recombinase XerC